MILKEQFELIYKDYYRALVLFAENYLSSREEAEDVVQDVFVKFWNRKESIEIGVDKLKSFLYSSVRNSTIDFMRLKSRKEGKRILLSALSDGGEEVLSEVSENYSGYEEEMLQAEKIRKIYCAIEELPEKCRMIFKKVYLEDKDYKSVAQELGLSLNTVKVQMYRAYTKLRGIDILLFFLIFL